MGGGQLLGDGGGPVLSRFVGPFNEAWLDEEDDDDGAQQDRQQGDDPEAEAAPLSAAVGGAVGRRRRRLGQGLAGGTAREGAAAARGRRCADPPHGAR